MRKGHGAGPGLRRYASAGPWVRWRRAGYVGCNPRWFLEDPRPAFVTGKRAVLRGIDLGRFGFFDLDAYGSPREAALMIGGRCTVRPGSSSRSSRCGLGACD